MVTQKKKTISNTLIIWNEFSEFKRVISVSHALIVWNINTHKIIAQKTLSEVSKCL